MQAKLRLQLQRRRACWNSSTGCHPTAMRTMMVMMILWGLLLAMQLLLFTTGSCVRQPLTDSSDLSTSGWMRSSSWHSMTTWKLLCWRGPSFYRICWEKSRCLAMVFRCQTLHRLRPSNGRHRSVLAD